MLSAHCPTISWSHDRRFAIESLNSRPSSATSVVRCKTSAERIKHMCCMLGSVRNVRFFDVNVRFLFSDQSC